MNGCINDVPVCGDSVCKEVLISTNNPRHKNKKYDLRIQELNVGYLINVGCNDIAIQDLDTMLKLVNEYYTNYDALIKRYEEGNLFTNTGGVNSPESNNTI